MRGRWTWLGVLVLVSARAGAAVQQPGGPAVPILPTEPERNLVTQSYGWSASTQCFYDTAGNVLTQPIILGEYYSPPAFPQLEDDDAITLQGLFKWRREALSWTADASSPTGAFVPSCPIAVEPLLQGGTCKSKLTWYNVPDPVGGPPASSELHELIPADLATFLACKNDSGTPKTDGFCPLAWDNRSPRNLSKLAWTPNHVTVDLAQDPRYTGGAIGFALVSETGSAYCGGTHYSVREHNTRNLSGAPYVGALVYESKVEPGAVYLAFEDGLMTAADWTNGGKTDGDYNDYVAYVSGCFGANGAGGQGAAGEAAGGQGTGSAGSAGTTSSGGSSGGGSGTGSSGSAPHGTAGAATNEAGEQSAGDAGTGNDQPGAGNDAGSSNAGADTGGSTDSSDSGGCGCRVANDSGSTSALLLAAGLGFARLWRRRARR